MDSRQNKILFSQIIQGFCPFFSKKFGIFYIKHFTPIDSAEVDFIYSIYYAKAINEGLPKLENREKEIIDKQEWSLQRQKELQENKKFLDSIIDIRSKLYLKSKRDSYTKSIEETEKKINELELEKFSLIGQTAESFAIKKSNEIYIEYSFYKNKELKERLLTSEEFDELGPEETKELFEIFDNYNKEYNSLKIKKLGMSSFFLNLFHLSSDNATDFYGKPLIHLTFHQIDLWGIGRYMKNVLSNWGSQIPTSILNEPDKLNEWLEIQNNFKEFEQKEENKEGGALSLVGATKKDLEYLGINTNNVIDFKKIAESKGKKSLNMDDIMAVS